MVVYVKAWQNVFRGASRELHNEIGLWALDALKYGKRYFVNDLTFDFAKEITEVFIKENPNFRFDNLEVIVEPVTA